MFKPGPIIVLLALALFLQNTCPHGFAGKTSVVSTCETCPMHLHHKPLPDQQERIAAGQTAAHYPLFIFSLPDPLYVPALSPLSASEPVIADRYTDAPPAELLRPPRS